VLLELLYGEKWIHAASALSIYCVLILLFALNGLTEAYFFAAASPAELMFYNKVPLPIFSGL
jgi:O-antigen/teichoic acid export membrane protein